MHIFKQNKYTKCYIDLINKAKVRKIDSSEYYEKHHILPKSLGGTNDPDNLVKLTAREHFICHRLLVKMTANDDHRKKMIYAAWCMTRVNSSHGRIKITNRTYSILKEENIKIWRNASKGRVPWNKGKKASEETLVKMRGKSPANKGKPGIIPDAASRLRNSQSVKDALAKLKSDPRRWAEYSQRRSDNSGMKKTVVVEGIEFGSMTSASKATGISLHLLRKYYITPSSPP